MPNPLRRELIVSRDIADATMPGVLVERTAEEADAEGLTGETALSEADAFEANVEE